MANERVVECVPNFSEGRDKAKIKAITDAIEAVSGVRLLDVEMGADTHRTVVTFVGPPEAVLEAAFQGIARASQLIDLSVHKGEHPRMGATDVCPFVPVEGVTMQQCVALAQKLGERVGRELEIPVYLYEEAATKPERKSLSEIRKGEYEGLAKKLADPRWAPDFGPARFNPRAGATVIGAREFLIAYNITLNTADKNKAADLAFALREKGRVARSGNTAPYYSRGKKLFYAEGAYPCGSCPTVAKSYEEVKSHCAQEHGYDLDALLMANELAPPKVEGSQVYRPGRFAAVKAIGWYVDEYKRAQVSINLTNYKLTSPHVVLEEARRLAAERGLVVTGSEIVGLVPWGALWEAGRYYLKRQGSTVGLPRADVLRAAAFSMGLSDVAPFEIEKKALGLPRTKDTALVRRTVEDFADEVSRPTPAPGGGSIAALAGALGASLASMVANLTYGKEGTEERDEALARIAEQSQQAKDELIRLVDDDTDAFNAFLTALRMPQATAEEKALRAQRMQEGLKIAIDVPWRTAELSFKALELCKEVAALGSAASLTDGAVGSQLAMAAVRGALWNVVINLKDLKDPAYVRECQEKSAKLLERAQKVAAELAEAVDKQLAETIAKKLALKQGA